MHFHAFLVAALPKVEIKTDSTLPAQYGDIVDLKDGLLNNRVCTVKVPVVKSYLLCNTTHTELHCTVLP